MKTASLLLAVVFPVVAFGAAPKQVQVLADGLTWTDLVPGVTKYAPISGDPKKGPFTFELKMTAGQESGWHTHDAEYSGVVVAGTVENVEQGAEADAKPMPPGSFWTQPGKKNHNTKCAAGADCVSVIMVKGGFTMHPMTPEGKPAPVAKPDAAAKDAKAPAGDAKKEPAPAKK